MKFHEDGTLAHSGEVFVFGSNLKGFHGAGAARVAENHFEAVMGKGNGHQGQSYAIPTKGFRIETLGIAQITEYINKFVHYTNTETDISFFVTRVGCGLAGFKDSEIAPLFKNAKNCSFAKTWKQYLED
jgi:hypothetical protein